MLQIDIRLSTNEFLCISVVRWIDFAWLVDSGIHQDPDSQNTFWDRIRNVIFCQQRMLCLVQVGYVDVGCGVGVVVGKYLVGFVSDIF